MVILAHYQWLELGIQWPCVAHGRAQPTGMVAHSNIVENYGVTVLSTEIVKRRNAAAASCNQASGSGNNHCKC